MRHAGIIIYQSELSDYWVNLIKDTGLNFIGVHPFSEKGLCGRTVAELVEWVKTPEARRILDRLAEMGVDVEYEMHALSWLLPRDMFSKHPEWFRMNEKGERVADYNCCPSNPEVIEYLSGRAADLFGSCAQRLRAFWIAIVFPQIDTSNDLCRMKSAKR